MAQFTINSATRLAPYAGHKFRVMMEGRYVAGVSKVSALKRTTEVIEHRDGGSNNVSHRSPGRVKYEPITLERGVTHDVEFERWANKVWDYGNAQAGSEQRTREVSLRDFRRDIIIDLFNEAGQKVLSYKVYRAWPSEYQAWADLDANANTILIASLKLEHEGWERDLEVTEPLEPSFDDPVV